MANMVYHLHFIIFLPVWPVYFTEQAVQVLDKRCVSIRQGKCERTGEAIPKWSSNEEANHGREPHAIIDGHIGNFAP